MSSHNSSPGNCRAVGSSGPVIHHVPLGMAAIPKGSEVHLQPDFSDLLGKVGLGSCNLDLHGHQSRILCSCPQDPLNPPKMLSIVESQSETPSFEKMLCSIEAVRNGQWATRARVTGQTVTFPPAHSSILCLWCFPLVLSCRIRVGEGWSCCPKLRILCSFNTQRSVLPRCWDFFWWFLRSSWNDYPLLFLGMNKPLKKKT